MILPTPWLIAIAALSLMAFALALKQVVIPLLRVSPKIHKLPVLIWAMGLFIFSLAGGILLGSFMALWIIGEDFPL
jgi:hypothetical protein